MKTCLQQASMDRSAMMNVAQQIDQLSSVTVDNREKQGCRSTRTLPANGLRGVGWACCCAACSCPCVGRGSGGERPWSLACAWGDCGVPEHRRTGMRGAVPVSQTNASSQIGGEGLRWTHVKERHALEKRVRRRVRAGQDNHVVGQDRGRSAETVRTQRDLQGVVVSTGNTPSDHGAPLLQRQRMLKRPQQMHLERKGVWRMLSRQFGANRGRSHHGEPRLWCASCENTKGTGVLYHETFPASCLSELEKQCQPSAAGLACFPGMGWAGIRQAVRHDRQSIAWPAVAEKRLIWPGIGALLGCIVVLVLVK